MKSVEPNIFGLFFVEPQDRKSLIMHSVKKYSEDIKEKEMEFLNVFLTTVLDHCIESIDAVSDNKFHEASTTYYINRVCYYAEDIFRLLYELDLSGEGYVQFSPISKYIGLPGRLLADYLERESEELNTISWCEMMERDLTTQHLVLFVNSDSGKSIKKSISSLRDAVTKAEVSELERILFGYDTDDSSISSGMAGLKEEPERNNDEPERNNDEPFPRIVDSNRRELDMRDTIMPSSPPKLRVPDGHISVVFHMNKTRDHSYLLGEVIEKYLSDSKWYELWNSAAKNPELSAEARIACNYSIGTKVAEEVRADFEKIGSLLYELTACAHISYRPGGTEGLAPIDDHGGFFYVLMDKGGKVSIEDVPII